MQSVTVEWFEGGETKGKEVRICNTLNGVSMDDVVEKFKYSMFSHATCRNLLYMW